MTQERKDEDRLSSPFKDPKDLNPQSYLQAHYSPRHFVIALIGFLIIVGLSILLHE